MPPLHFTDWVAAGGFTFSVSTGIYTILSSIRKEARTKEDARKAEQIEQGNRLLIVETQLKELRNAYDHLSNRLDAAQH